MGTMGIFAIIGTLIVAILIMRAIGSWMLRIDEVISNQKEMIKQNEEIINHLRAKKNVI